MIPTFIAISLSPWTFPLLKFIVYSDFSFVLALYQLLIIIENYVDDEWNAWFCNAWTNWYGVQVPGATIRSYWSMCQRISPTTTKVYSEKERNNLKFMKNNAVSLGHENERQKLPDRMNWGYFPVNGESSTEQGISLRHVYLLF